MKRFLASASVALCLVFGAVPAISETPETSIDTYRQLDLLMEVFEKIRAEYVEEVDDVDVLESAINGMLAGLDPHSSYMGPKNFSDMQVQTRGEYGGLGIEVVGENGVIKIVSPIDGTPAARAGLRSGDYITQINGEPIAGQTTDDAVEKMRGPIGTPITITIVRPPSEDEGESVFDVDLVRENITLASVASHSERDKFGYVRIRTFNEQSTRGTREAIKEIETELGKDYGGLVLDLRNNPGGLLDQAIAISDLFLDQGEVVSTRGRHARDTKRWHATPGDILHGKPLIVLVNAGSASASEIVAGALQDHRRGTILGDDTFGKGTVQTIIPLGADSALRLTTARYYTPSGRSIQERGIEPDIPVRQVLMTSSGRVRTPRRERDLVGHLVNEQQPVAEEAAVDAETGAPDIADPAIDRPVPELVEGGEPVDYQLEYALDLLEGVRQAASLQAVAAEKP